MLPEYLPESETSSQTANPTPPLVDWQRIRAAFMSEQRASGASKATLEYHAGCWTRFLKFWDGETPLDRFVLRGYLESLRETCNRTSINTYWRSLRTFFQWAYREELAPHDPSERVNAPKPDVTRKTPLEADAMHALLESANTKRDRAILALMLDTGLRRREVCELTADDVDLDAGSVTVRHSKSGRFRVVPIGPDAARIIRKWAHARDEHARTFFYSEGDRNKGEPLTPRGLRQAIVRIGQRAGVKVTPHLLRHSFARLWVVQGGASLPLQTFLGHSSLAVTERYVTLNFNDLRDLHAGKSPFTAVRRSGQGSKRGNTPHQTR